jgi:hypothetical protein
VRISSTGRSHKVLSGSLETKSDDGIFQGIVHHEHNPEGDTVSKGRYNGMFALLVEGSLP